MWPWPRWITRGSVGAEAPLPAPSLRSRSWAYCGEVSFRGRRVRARAEPGCLRALVRLSEGEISKGSLPIPQTPSWSLEVEALQGALGGVQPTPWGSRQVGVRGVAAACGSAPWGSLPSRLPDREGGAAFMTRRLAHHQSPYTPARGLGSGSSTGPPMALLARPVPPRVVYAREPL